MNFYIEFTQNKELKIGSIILSAFIRHAPILMYLFEFLFEIRNRRVDGFLIIFLLMGLVMLISSIHLSSLDSPSQAALRLRQPDHQVPPPRDRRAGPRSAARHRLHPHHPLHNRRTQRVNVDDCDPATLSRSNPQAGSRSS